jgi:hypothetical protein
LRGPSWIITENEVCISGHVFLIPKIVCATCAFWNPDGAFDRYLCQSCGHSYYCSKRCMHRDQSPTEGNHPSICFTLKKLAVLKVDRHCKSVIRLMLHLNARRLAQERRHLNVRLCRQLLLESIVQKVCGGVSDCGSYLASMNLSDEPRDSLPSPVPSMDDVLKLQSHLCNWESEDFKEWRKCKKFLETFLCFPETTILDMVSVIESNGFGIFGGKDQLLGRGKFTRTNTSVK